MSAFFAMGGYAAFVWPTYGLAAALIVGLIVWTHRRHARAVKAVAELDARRPARARKGAV
ncbi:heme exporter protein CcmD [Lacibacterium aquatile]|uniref:Heme exporter protein D n=1 Tax=Lacibacterium aquatile TaxID=1168082 RepID=A0ABW5E024_9PROT